MSDDAIGWIRRRIAGDAWLEALRGGRRAPSQRSRPGPLWEPRPQRRARRPHRAARTIARAAVAVLALAVLAADAYLLSARDASTPAELQRVLGEFRARPTAGTDIGPSEGAPGVARAPASDVPAPPPSRDAPARAAPQPFQRPARGVYAYRTNGYEQISVAGARHDYPERTYATVRRESGCRWELRHEVVEEHVDTFRYCASEGRHRSRGTTSEVEFFGKSDSETFRCEPMLLILEAGDRRGAVHRGVCRSDGTEARQRIEHAGRARLRIGGRTVITHHLVARTTLRGRVRGRADLELWLHPETGIFVRLERTVDTDADSPFGRIHYVEDATFELLSLQPRT